MNFRQKNKNVFKDFLEMLDKAQILKNNKKFVGL